MNHLGLFEGIGGFSLAARWMGWETVAWCEINPFCQKVLKHHFPEADSLTDIKQTDFTKYANRIDILTGGFPCQPYSVAGKQEGTNDPRHLWPEMLRAIREIKPVWVVGENVRGLVSWNGGLVFEQVQIDLENEGYEVMPFILPACSVNAPHKRERIWFVAHSQSNGDRRRLYDVEKTNGSVWEPEKHRENESEFRNISTKSDAANANSQRLQSIAFNQQPSISKPEKTFKRSKFSRTLATEIGWRDFPTQPPVCGGNDGIPAELDATTFSKWRSESIKAYGNAIVPQVALQIFKSIEQYNS